jgi:tetratricopeptide (TPR) repeat protein
MSVLVVAESPDHAQQLMKLLATIGLSSAQVVHNGDQAWNVALAKELTFVALGWRVPGVSGLAFLNRLRRHALAALTPVLVASQHLGDADFALLQEFPCTSHLPIPWTTNEIRARYQGLLKEADWYKKNGALVESLVEMAGQDGDRALELMRGPLAAAPNVAPLAILTARMLRQHGHLEQARTVLADLLARDPDSVLGHSEAGKVHFLLGDHARAKRSLELAHQRSPRNLERLALLGEASLSEGRAEDAEQMFSQALEIDPKDPVSQVGMSLVKTAQGTAVVPNKDAVGFALAGILNGKAIALARSGKVGEAVTHYQAALGCLLGGIAMAQVSFNVGLAFLRWRKPQDALPWFERAVALSGGRLRKAEKYAATISGAATEQQTFALGDAGDFEKIAAGDKGGGYQPLEKPVEDPAGFEEESLLGK